MEWLPVRFFGLTLGLVGDFRPVINQLGQSFMDFQSPSIKLTKSYVRAAIHGNKITPATDIPETEIDELEQIPGLIDRALVTWIAAIGLIAVL